MEFVDRINEIYCDKDGRPFRNIRIHHTLILDDPFGNPKGLVFPDSPAHFSDNLVSTLIFSGGIII